MITASEKLIIPELSKEDVDVIFELYSDKEAMKYRGSKSFENREEAVVMINTVIENIKNGIEFRYGIVERSSNELIGTFLITPVSERRQSSSCLII